MFIKKLIFPKDNESIKNPMFNNLPSLDFCYSKGNNAKEIAKFVILIGKNGSGKTSLLILIRKLIECYEMCQKNTPSLKKHDCDHFTIDLSLIDREINFLFEKPSNDYYLQLENMDIFNPDKELFCKVFCDNNKNNISINCISLPTSFSIDKNKNEDYCSEIYEEDKKRNDYLEYTIKLINCYNISLAKQIQNESKNINVRERYDQLFSKFGIKTFGDSIKKDIYFNINKKFNRTINQLPSGFRQLFNLWKAMLENNDTIFLIDEPENSLYPLEQEKISSFFTREFEKNIKTQFFIATHSPFIIKNFLNCNDAVIINVETGENILKSEEKKLLLNENNNVSYDEISYLYYDVVTSNYYISLYEELKYKVDAESYNEVDKWLIMNKDKINEIIKEKKLDKNNFVEIEKIKCIKHGKLNNDGEIIEEKQLIVFYLGELGDGNYTDWDSFVEKFKDENWKKEEKNQKIIGELCNLLKCQSNEIYDRINGLDEETKKQAKELFENKQHDTPWTTSTNLTRLRHMFAHAWTREKNFLFYKKHSEQFKNNNNDEEIAKTNKFYSIFKKENVTNEEIESLLKEYIELMRKILINWEKLKTILLN